MKPVFQDTNVFIDPKAIYVVGGQEIPGEDIQAVIISPPNIISDVYRRSTTAWVVDKKREG